MEQPTLKIGMIDAKYNILGQSVKDKETKNGIT